MDKIKLALFPMELAVELKDLQVTLKSLQEKLIAKYARIESLEEQIAHLDCELDKCEQYSRGANIRIQGISETVQGEDTDTKVLDVFNEKMGLIIPVKHNQIERSH